jgi:hypothetical protein
VEQHPAGYASPAPEQFWVNGAPARS